MSRPLAPSLARREIARRSLDLVTLVLPVLVALAATGRAYPAVPVPAGSPRGGTGSGPAVAVIGAGGTEAAPGVAGGQLRSSTGSALSGAGDYAPGLVCIEPGDQVAPQAVPDGQGGAIVAWTDARSGNLDVYAQHVQATMALDPAWPTGGLAVCSAPGDQTNVRMIPDGAGGAIVTWEDGRAGNSDIYAQHLLASGATDSRWPTDGLALSIAAGNQRYPSLDGDDSFGAIVAWQDEQGQNPEGYVQHVLAAGTVDATWPPEGVYLPGESFPAWPVYGQHVVADGQHGALLLGSGLWPNVARHVLANGELDPAWQPTLGAMTAVSDGAGGAYALENSVSLSHLLASGSAELRYFMTLWHVSATSLAIVPDGAGGALAAFTVPPPDPPSMNMANIHAVLVRSSGEVVRWSLPEDHNPPPGYPSLPPGVTSECAIATDGAGGALVVWTDDRTGAHPDIYLQHVLGSGASDSACPEFGRSLSAWTNHAARAAQVVADGAGGGLVVWQGGGSDGSWDIYAARIPGDAPTGVLVTLVTAEASAGRARLEWYCSGMAGPLATIYRRAESSDWRPVGTASPDGVGHLGFVDRDVTAGARYGYRLGIVEGGREAFYGETWLAIPPKVELALHGLQPNPAGSSAVVAFTLPDDRPARLAVLDLSGRRVLDIPLGAPGPGTHVVGLDAGRRLPAGLYFLQLSHGGRTLTRRGVVAR